MSGHTTAADGYGSQIEELDRVRLARAVTADGGRKIEAGACGTIVAIYGRGAAFCVEFTESFQGLATVSPDDIEAIPEETRARLAAATPIRR